MSYITYNQATQGFHNGYEAGRIAERARVLRLVDEWIEHEESLYYNTEILRDLRAAIESGEDVTP